MNWQLIRVLSVILAMAQSLAGTRAVVAQPICSNLTRSRPTLRDDAESCPIVVYARLDTISEDPKPGGSTTFAIVKTLKSSPALMGRTTIAVPRRLDIPQPRKPVHYLLFADVDKAGQLDVWKGSPCTPALLDFFASALAIDIKNRRQLVTYCFDFLNHDDKSVSQEALQEFRRADDLEIRGIAQGLKPDKLRQWLRDSKIADESADLFGLFLGLCGTPNDAATLRLILDLGKERQQLHRGRLLTGYAMLAPKEGWELTTQIINDQKASFAWRNYARQNACYFHDYAATIIDEQQILAFMLVALQGRDMTNLVIDDLKRWKCWRLTDSILSLASKKEFDHPLIQRSILRYAMCCPDNAAKQYKGQIREKNPDFFAEIEESLKYEKP